MTSKTIIVVSLIVALLGGTLLYLSSTGNAPSAPYHKAFSLNISGKKLLSGDSVLQVRQGDSVTIKVTSDEDEEFHLHGYDLSVDLVAGTEETLTFVADASGRFPFELEESKVEIGALEVLP